MSVQTYAAEAVVVTLNLVRTSDHGGEMLLGYARASCFYSRSIAYHRISIRLQR